MKRISTAVFQGALALGLLAATVTPSLAADVREFYARKGRLFVQTSTATPETHPLFPFYFIAVVDGNEEAILSALVATPPFGSPLDLQLNADSERFELIIPAPDLEQLNQFFGSGNYTFQIDSDNDGFSFATLNLSGSNFPNPIPHVSNFDAAQAIKPAEDFTVRFNGSSSIRFELEISDDVGGFYTITDTGSTATIPAGALDPNSQFYARLRFLSILDEDAFSYPGAVGSTALFTETEFTISTGTGGGGGGNDTTPPALALVLPASGSTAQNPQLPLTFQFSEPMQSRQSIEWSANINPANFTLQWADPQTLVVFSQSGFPADATITWRLNPTAGAPGNFRDLAGNELPTLSGSFGTGAGSGGGPIDPCDGNEVDAGQGFAAIGKLTQFVQAGASSPTPDPETPANFYANFKAATNRTVTAVTLAGPAATVTLDNNFGLFFNSQVFANPAALDAGVPSGNYTLNAVGAGSATLALGSAGQVPVPRFSNLVELAALDVTQPFTLQFAPFTGAGSSDSISIQINDTADTNEFHAPDPCLKRELANTATSVVIPANTFKAGRTLRGSVSFSKVSFDQNSIPNTQVTASISASTTFELTLGAGPNRNQPRWTTIVRKPDGKIGFNISADSGVTVVIEATENFRDWATATTLPLPQGTGEFLIDPKTATRKSYRAKLQ